MPKTELKFGIPDIDLVCASGTCVNPSSFAGHELIILFCPTDPELAAREIDAYRKQASELVARDAWIIAFEDQCGPAGAAHDEQPLRIADKDRHAWVAFRDLTHSPGSLDRGDGATFLFRRGGGLHRYWHGSGHVHDVLEELAVPSWHHKHDAGA